MQIESEIWPSFCTISLRKPVFQIQNKMRERQKDIEDVCGSLSNQTKIKRKETDKLLNSSQKFRNPNLKKLLIEQLQFSLPEVAKTLPTTYWQSKNGLIIHTYHWVYISRTTAFSPAASTIGQNVSLFTSVTCPTTASAVLVLDDRTTTLVLLFSCVRMDTPTDDDTVEEEIEIACGEAHDGEAEERIGGGERERRRAIVPNCRDYLEEIGEDQRASVGETSNGSVFNGGREKVVVHIIFGVKGRDYSSNKVIFEDIYSELGGVLVISYKNLWNKMRLWNGKPWTPLKFLECCGSNRIFHFNNNNNK